MAATLVQVQLAPGAAAEESADSSSSTTVNADSLSIVSNKNAYRKYIARYPDAAKPMEEVNIDVTKFEQSDDINVQLEDYDGEKKCVAWVDCEGTLTWKFDVKTAGLYNLEMFYHPITATNTTIEVEMKIDGEYPFDEVKLVELDRYWQNETQIGWDARKKNQKRPPQVEYNTWVTYPIKDKDGLINTPYFFYLSEGEHEISLTGIKTNFYLKSMKFYNTEELPSYADIKPTQEQIDAVNAIFADYELSTDDTLGHFAVNGFFTSTYDDVRDLNLNNFLAYFGECGEEDISEEEFAQLNAKWEFRVDSVEDFPLPIHRYPASAVEDVLKRFAGIGLADLTDMQTPFSGYTYLEDTDAFYTTTSDYNPGYFRCTSGEIEPDGDTVLLYGSTAGSLSGKAVLKLVKDGENWYIHSFTLASPEQSTVQEEQVPTTEPQSTLPIPASSMFGLTGREAVLFDAAVAQRYPRSDNDIVLPSLREYGSFEENGKTVVICDLHYDFYYDYTGPDWEWNGGGATTVARFELDAPGNVCTGFAEYPSGSLSDWIRDFCGPLAVQNADGAWGLPETSGDWFPAVENLLQQYLEVIASTAPSSDAPAADSLSDDMIWEYVHEKLDYAHWAQDMTAEYEDIVRKFQIEDSKMSDLPGDVSQWPRYYSAFVDYFSAANADLRYLDADTIWTKDLSEDRQSLIVTLTRADVILMLSYSIQTSQITEVSTRRNAVLQSVTGDSITAEHITLLNASLEEDLQTLKALNIPPQNYYYGYYRVDSGELYTYKVDPNASVTIYDIEQEYGAGEDRLYTFKTWRDFAAAVQENEGLLVQPYTLTLKNGVVVKIEEKFYH